MKLVVFGGGGNVAKHVARLAQGTHDVVSVVRNDSHDADLLAVGAWPHVLSLETATTPEIAAFLESELPSPSDGVVIFSAGAGGKGGPERTRAVDYDAAVRVFDACEQRGLRVLLVSAIDTRDRSKGYPAHYNEQSRAGSDRVWGAIGTYMQAKTDSEAYLHTRPALAYTVLRPGLLTNEPAHGVELGVTQMGAVSREAVAQVLIACAENAETAGLTIDVMDGKDDVVAAVDKVAAQKIDAWEKM